MCNPEFASATRGTPAEAFDELRRRVSALEAARPGGSRGGALPPARQPAPDGPRAAGAGRGGMTPLPNACPLLGTREAAARGASA